MLAAMSSHARGTRVSAIDPLRGFVEAMTRLVGEAPRSDESHALVERARALLAELVARDDWLPESMARAPASGYAQNLLWCDPLERFSVVSFVWAPGASTPVHDHLVWGLVGMLRGSESAQSFARNEGSGALTSAPPIALHPGQVEVVLPSVNDIHKVGNLLEDRPSISIHVYGGNIGAVRRHAFDPLTGRTRSFVSGYSNREQPNLWDRFSGSRAPVEHATGRAG